MGLQREENETSAESGNSEIANGVDWSMIKYLLPASLEPGYLPAFGCHGQISFNKFLSSVSPMRVFFITCN